MKLYGLKTLVSATLVSALLAVAPAASAQIAGLSQTFFVPLPEDQIQETLTALNTNGATTSTSIQSVVSIVPAPLGPGTVIVYDHWEDGYEFDLSNPTQPSTQIWGDNNPGNGIPPGFTTDLINSGDVLILSDLVATIPSPAPFFPGDRVVPSTPIKFGGRDRFSSNRALAVSRVAWAPSPGTVLAGAVEVSPISTWGQEFTAPIGDDLSAVSDQMFELARASYMASEDNTLLEFDADNDGTFEGSVILNRGDSLIFPIQTSGKSRTDKPVQLHAMTGDIGAQYESRWGVVLPSDQWTGEYFVPVSTRTSGTADPTDVFAYNPNDVAITVQCQTTAATPVCTNTAGAPQASLSIPALGIGRFRLPDGSGARFVAPEEFYVVITVDSNADIPENGGQTSDTNNRNFDWGLATGVRTDELTSAVLVGFAPSIDPTACNSTPPFTNGDGPFDCPAQPAGGGSPVWVMSTQPPGGDPTTVYVDFDGDPATGTIADGVGGLADRMFELAPLERAKIFDDNPATGEGDNDNTGTLIYTTDGTALVAAWGQDPASSDPANPFLDAGTFIPALPLITLAKDVNLALANPGDTLIYTISVTNNSRAQLASVILSDVLPPYVTQIAGGTCPTLPADVGPLNPGITFTCTIQVVVDIDVPIDDDSTDACPDPQTRLLNVATAQAGATTLSDDALTCVEIAPSIDIEKATNGQDADLPTGPLLLVGSSVDWTYVVTNTGNVPLSSIDVIDDQGVIVSCPQTSLDPAASMICTASGTVVAGQYTNIGTAAGTPPVGPPVEDSDPSNHFGVLASIDIEKATNGQDADLPTGPLLAVGSSVDWTYVVTNTGNVTLTGINVTDDQGVVVSCPQTSLAPAASMICTASGTVVAGQYTNIGTASGTPPVGPPVEDSDPSNHFGAAAAIDIEKATNGDDADTATGPLLAVGSSVDWTYVVTNTGNVTLTGITVTDDQGVVVSCPQTSLAPAASMICTASGTVVAGQYTNIGTASGTPPVGPPVEDTDPSNHFGATATIDIEKATNGDDADTATGPLLAVGSSVDWTYVVTNTGNVTLTGINVTDDQGVIVSCPQTSLAPAASMICTASGTVVAGQYTNIGTASGTPPAGPPVEDSDPSNHFGVLASIDIEKATNGQDADTPTGPVLSVGDPVSWTYVVTNTGNVTLTGINVTDDQGVVVSCPQTSLAPAASMTCTAAGTVVAGQYTNIGTASGTPPVGPPVEDSDPSNYLGQLGGTIIIAKSTNPPGDTQSFEFTDNIAPPNTFSLADGDTITFLDVPPGNYVVTEKTPPLGIHYELTDVTCFDPSGNSSGDLFNRRAQINVANGETVRCTFFNTQATPIPSVSQWGLVLLSIITAAIAGFRLRNRES